MNNIKTHTRNQKRMYRIHKQEEKIKDYELLIGKLQQELTDYKERNDKLQSQYMQEQARNYHLNYVIENDLLPTLKGYEAEIATWRNDFEAQHELTKKYALQIMNLQQELTDYKERNEKAVEFLEEKLDECGECLCYRLTPIEREVLLEILDKKEGK